MDRLGGVEVPQGNQRIRRSGYYRIVKPFEALHRLYPEYEVDVVGADFLTRFGETTEEIFRTIFETYDIVVCKHVDNPVAASALLAVGQHYKKPVVFDLDDCHLYVKPGTPAWDAYAPGKPKRAFVSTALSLASGLIVSTHPLKDAYKGLNKKIDVIPNGNDVSDWNYYRVRKNDGKVRIGYMGSVTHNADFDLVTEALKEVLRKYPDAELELLGLMHKTTFQAAKKKFRAMKGRVTLHFGTPSWKGYPELLGNMGWDIGIAPLVDDPFNKCKSHIKWMEYAMYQIPTVASKVYPYAEPIDGVKTIEHGKTGFLCATKEEWVDALSQLVESAELRQQIGEAAYNHVKENWQFERMAHQLKKVLDKHVNAVQ